MKERAAPALLAGVALALTAATASLDLPAASAGRFWSDGATYYAAALSVAFDGDLVYEARDVLRVRREWGAGPQGIFLKRAAGGLTRAEGFPWFERIAASEPRIYYAKAFAYPLAAAPFARVLRTRGLLLFNGLCLAVTLGLGYLELRRRAGPFAALAATLALVLLNVTPAYAIWLQPEVFNLALLAGALLAWSRGWPLASALLFAVATYSKPSNLLVALPLGAAPFLEAGAGGFARRLLEAARRGAVLGAAVAALYGANALVTGEVNYQGGERKTFYDSFPFEGHGVSFGNSGIWMTTEHVGPRVEGESDENMRRGEGAALARLELEGAFLANLGYFWTGRFAGAVPYFLPIVLAAALFLAVGPRVGGGWLALGALFISYVFYIWLIPANWFGGAGALGNRYFLNLVPLAFFFLPRGREWTLALAGGALSLVFVGPILLAPLTHALRPWSHGLEPTLRSLPLELTMLNDLPIFLEIWRKKQPYADAEGDPATGRPGPPDSYWLYFPDDASYGRAVHEGREGFWLRDGREAEIVLRAQEPVRELQVQALASDGASVVASCGEAAVRLEPRGAAPAAAALTPGKGLLYYDSFVYVLRLRADARPGGADDRAVFVGLALSVTPRR